MRSRVREGVQEGEGGGWECVCGGGGVRGLRGVCVGGGGGEEVKGSVQ